MRRWDIYPTTRRRLRPVISQKVSSPNEGLVGRADHPAAQSQGHNIRRYSEYLIARASAFEATKTDYVKNGPGRLKRLSVEKGLLREAEIVQKQIRALLRCDVGEIHLNSFLGY